VKATEEIVRRVGVTVVIVSYFTGPTLDSCLDSALADPDVIEVILIDNGNPDDVSPALAKRGLIDPRLVVLQGHGNVGFAAGCNMGAVRAHGDVLLFLNPDAILDAGSAGRLAEIARDGSPPRIVGGRLFCTNRVEQRGSRRGELTLWSAILGFAGLGRPGADKGIWRSVHREKEALPTQPEATPVVSGALMAMRMDTFRLLSGFDEGYFLHVEDIDICRRTRALGGSVTFVPDASAVHVGSTSRVSRFSVEWNKARGLVRYFMKFAETPLERAAVMVSAPLIAFLIMVRTSYLVLRR